MDALQQLTERSTIRPILGVVGLVGIFTALLPWVQGGIDIFHFEASGMAHGGWLMVMMGTVYLVAMIEPVSWKTLAGASVIGLVAVIFGLISSTGQTYGPISYGWILALLTVIASLVVVWKVRSQTST